MNRNAIISQKMMGIGSGAGVLNSGEAAVFPLLPRQPSEPLVVFDVGSNHGQFLNLTRRSLAGTDFLIHCFEPGQKTFESLSSQETDSRVTLNNIAVGNCEESRTLFYDQYGSGMASLTKRELNHRGIQFDKSEEVSVTTIDRYCEKHGIQGIDLLKLDIEGHELDALKGADETFSRNAIRLVTFEMGGCNIDTRTFFRDFWNFFTQRNMSLHRITPSGSLIKIRRYKESHEQFRTTNFLAIRHDH
ncbi:FkbM family methyltransferase [Rhodopirellula europaea]|uniref:FkbM family methyltransferase n=1 Tax=Rhodopirellula europaea TaxID=1263866 RepID=UPI001F1CDA3B|nr:FkbM family methyltransferase [Rhodopirellula europaea]